MTVAAGSSVGPYEVVERLGAGGMAEVYRAHDPRLGRDVAVKLVLTDGPPDVERLGRFEREARAVAALSHPNVTTVYDVGSLGGRPYLVLELLEGETLRQRLDRGSLPLRQAVEIAIEVCHGLEAAHARSLVHCDLKPENLFLTADGRVKILDFGIAQLAPRSGDDPSETETKPGLQLGTLAYLSPEQARGLVPDARSDLFALGAVLYEMLGGRRAFRGASVADTLAAILHEDPPPARTAHGPIPAVLDRIVRRCLHKDRDERFHSAHDLALALEAVLDRPLPGAGGPEQDGERAPYPGLSAFTEADAGRFFGRESEGSVLWQRLREKRLLAVIGPSGAGKTSFVRAGIAAAQPTGWAILVCTPGPAPMQQLGQCLAPHLAGDPEALRQLVRFEEEETALSLLARWRRGYVATLLIVDQFEELFTLNPAESQARFARLLGRAAAEADVRVLLATRDDFLMRCHDHAALAGVFEGIVPLGAPAGEALRRALVEPARAEGYRFEEGLADEMLSAVEGERGALPLLAFAVARLWGERDRRGRVLTRSAYEAIGGVAGALARHAEETLDRIGAAREATVREVFRNLVTAEGTRASVDREELLSAFRDRGRAEEVLDELVDARLLTTYEQRGRNGERRYRVEIIHESLLRAWPRLVRWQTQDAEGALLRDQLRQASRLWAEKGRPADLLWSGTSYREWALWRERYPGALTAVEEEFARAMVERAESRRRRRRLAVAGAFAALLVVLAVIGVLLRRTNRALDRSVLDEARARASKLVALGRVELDRDSTAAVAYARKSLETADTIEARLLAVEALWRGPTARVLRVPETSGMRAAFSPDGRWVAVGGFGTSVTLLSDDGRIRRQLDGLPAVADPRGVAFDPDGSRLLSFVVRDPVVRLFDLEGRPAGTVPVEAETVRFDDRGRMVALGPSPAGPAERVVTVVPRGGTPRTVGRWRPARDIGTDHAGTRAPTAFARDPRWLAHGDGSRLLLHPLDRPGETSDVLVGEHPGVIRAVAFDLAGDRLVSADDRGEFRLWDAASRRLLLRASGPAPHRYSLLSFDPAGSRVVWSSGAASATCVWELDGVPACAIRCFRRDEAENGGGGSFHPSGDWIASADYGTLALWPARSPLARILPGHLEGPVLDLAFSPDSRTLASGARDGARLWPLDPKSGEPRKLDLPREHFAYGLAWSPDGRQIAISAPVIGAYLAPARGGPARLILPYPAQTMALGRVAFDREGRRVAVASHYAAEARHLRVYLVDLVLGRVDSLPLRQRDDEGPWVGGVRAVGFGHDGRLLLAGDGGVRRWDPASGATETLAGGPGTFASMSGDGKGRRVVAILGRSFEDLVHIKDSRVVVLDLATREQRLLPGHGDQCTLAIATDPSGKVVVTGDRTGIVRVGTAEGGEPHLLLGHSGAISRVAVSPDGRWIASAAGNEIRLWPMPDLSKTPLHALPYGELMARLRALTNVEVVEDPASPTGHRTEIGPFPGWRDVPTW